MWVLAPVFAPIASKQLKGHEYDFDNLKNPLNFYKSALSKREEDMESLNDITDSNKECLYSLETFLTENFKTP